MFQSSAALGILIKYRYLALFPLACIEGPIIALAVGFMIHLGYLSFIPDFLILILGDFIPDSIYYFIGNLNNKEKIFNKYDTKSKLISKNFKHIEGMWQNHSLKTMLVCKLAYGLSTPLLILAGLTRISYFKFIWQSVTVTIFNYGILMLLGYFLGKSYQTAIPYVKDIGVIIAVTAIIFFVIYFSFQKYMTNKIIETIEK